MSAWSVGEYSMILITPYPSLSHIFSERKNNNPGRYFKLQTEFTGSFTSLRTHIARSGMDHFEIYRTKCTQQKILLNERAIPKEEAEARNVATAELVVMLFIEFLIANRDRLATNKGYLTALW
jgi:hypothetical protein